MFAPLRSPTMTHATKNIYATKGVNKPPPPSDFQNSAPNLMVSHFAGLLPPPPPISNDRLEMADDDTRSVAPFVVCRKVFASSLRFTWSSRAP